MNFAICSCFYLRRDDSTACPVCMQAELRMRSHPFIVNLQGISTGIAIEEYGNGRRLIADSGEINRISSSLACRAIVALNSAIASALCAGLRLVFPNVPQKFIDVPQNPFTDRVFGLLRGA